MNSRFSLDLTFVKWSADYFVSIRFGDIVALHLSCFVAMAGGRKVIKAHLKHQEAVKTLTKRSMSIIAKKIDDFEVAESLPPALHPIVNPMVEKVAQFKQRTIEGEKVIKNCLEFVNDEKLNTLKSIYHQSSGKLSEDKMIQSAYVFIDEISQLDGYINHLNKVKSDLINGYVETFASNYNMVKSGVVCYDNDTFKLDINDAINYRRGIRRRVEVNGTESNDQLISEDANRCVVM